MHINMSWWYVKHDRLCYMRRMVCHELFCDTAKEEFSILYFWVVCWQNIWTFCRWHKSNKKAQGCMKSYTSSSTSSSGCGGSFLAITIAITGRYVCAVTSCILRPIQTIASLCIHWSTRQNKDAHFKNESRWLQYRRSLFCVFCEFLPEVLEPVTCRSHGCHRHSANKKKPKKNQDD